MATTRTTSRTAEGPVDRAFHLLQVVVAANEPLGVRELGRRTGLPRSTASRLVATLERLRMLDRNADGDIIPGGGLASLHAGAATAPLLRDRLHPLLTELASTFGENAALAIDDGDALLYLSNVSSANAVSVGDVANARHEFHLVAPGLMTMALWPPERLTQHLRNTLRSATPHSVTRSSAVRTRLRHIAIEGFAWTDQELDVGINGLAVPVSLEGEFVATISLYGPSYRFSPLESPDLASNLISLVATRLGDGQTSV